MATFYIGQNNSVTAVVTEKTYQELEQRRELIKACEEEGRGTPNLPPVRPIFTFADGAHHRGFVTGTNATMRLLLAGHQVVNNGLWVPFSNGDHERCREFITTMEEAIQVFGLVSTLK
ncbi:MAG: hypothetical protein KBD29_04205 [Candidatus Magasanikbacteria bacterium]|jgi:hypothetical protein|nr:hypothetical protein [Candidatus Magasanikbacteria bacterium]